jgi:CRISPR-associated protein Csm3
MRSLLELAYGEHNNGKVSDRPDSRCGALFGVSASSKDSNAHASRILVRDAMWIDTDVNFDKTDLYLAESKTEVNIDRITSKANPRTQERVPRGAQFRFEAVLNIFDGDNEAQYDADVRKAIALLEDDYLGGHGSRGYGRIKFVDLKKESKNTDNY